MYHKSNEEDPYITLPDVENDELEDFMIRPSDDVILSAVMEEDGWSHLDVCILPDSQNAELYVHHDYMLPAFPLCVAWVPPNMAAVGTFHPQIELWDLNIIDSAEPEAKLEGHEDAVLGLAAHPLHHQMLASASADTTVRLWDISTQQSILTMNHHKTKVQSLAWSPANSSTEFQGLLASGGFDQKTFIIDVRAHENVTEIPLEADVEALRWLTLEDGANPLLFVSTEAGDVICYDIVAGKRRWTLSAHMGSPCSSFSLFQPCPGAPTLLATATPSTPAPLKLWTIDFSRGGGPSCIYQKTSDFGRLHSVAFSQERPFHLAMGGHSKHPQVVNVLELGEVQRAYANIPGLAIPSHKPSSTLRTMTANDLDGDSDEERDEAGAAAAANGMDMDEEGGDAASPSSSNRRPAAKKASSSSNKYNKRPAIGASKKKKL